MNIPDAKKKARGAQPQLADWRLIGNGARYDLEDFSSFAERVLSSPNSEGGAAGQKPASGSGDPGSIASSPVQVANLSDLGLSKDEPDALTEAIVSCIPLSDRPEMWKAPGLPDRSAVVYFVACELHRRGVEPGKIAGALLNPNWLISDHVHEQTDPTRYWIVIDNCDRPIEGDFLCSMLSQELVQTRILSRSEQVRLPTQVLVIATGNNLVLSGDVSRRAVICRLDAKVERPDMVPHSFDPRQEARTKRPELVAAGRRGAFSCRWP